MKCGKGDVEGGKRIETIDSPLASATGPANIDASVRGALAMNLHSRSAGLAGLWLLLGSAASVAGGIDGGYTLLSSAQPGGPAVEWVDISASGTVVAGLADDNSAAAQIPLPSGFPYFGTTVNNLKIGSNGWVAFNNVSNIASCFPTIPTPGGAADNYLAPYVADLNFTGAGNPGQVRYFHDAPGNRFIVSYIDVPYWSINAPGWTGSTNFQVVLDLASGSIRFNYQSLSAPSFNAACNDLSIGIEGPDGTQGISFAQDTAVAAPLSLLFLPPGGIEATPAAGLATDEGGATASFDVVLSSPPTADVTIPVSTSDASEGSVAVSSLTFTPANWSTPQDVIVTGVDDALVDGAVAYTIALGAATSSDTRYAGLDPADVAVTNADNDVAGVSVSPPDPAFTTEAGGASTFSLALTAQPAADVVVPLSSSDASEGTLALAGVTFTTANWNVPQTVVVTGADDALDDGDIAYGIVTGATTSADPAFAGLESPDVALSNTDNDSAGVTLTPPASPVTTEAGGTASFSLVLTAQPSADVSIALASNDTSEGTLAVGSATFTAANWNQPQVFTVTGVDDAAVDGNAPYIVVTGDAASADPAFDGLAVADVPLTNTDDDSAGITIADVALSEGSSGTTPFTFAVTLGAAVSGGFTVSYATADGSATAPADYTAAAGTLTFAGNAGEVQTFAVTVNGDAVPEADETFDVTLGTPSNPAVTLTDGAATGTILDDDDDADLSLTLVATPDPVAAGSQLTYTATVSNAGPNDATSASVTLPLPASTSLVSGTVTGGGTCTGTPVVCTLAGNLAAGTSRTVTIVLAVDAATAAATTLAATATAASALPDPNSANNSATASATVATVADLVLTLTGPSQAIVGQPATFTANARNIGPSAAQNVVVSVTLPAGLGYIDHTPDAGANCTAPAAGQSGIVSCTWPGATAPGATRTLQVRASGAAPGTAQIAASSNSQTADPTPADNTTGFGVSIGASAAVAPLVIPIANAWVLMLLALGLGGAGIVAKLRRGGSDSA